MNQKLTQNTRPWCYWLLLASQSAGAGIVLWQGVPIYRRLLLGTPDTGPRLSVMLLALLAMALIQPAYWVARRHSPVVGRVPRPVLGHVVQFLGRLTLIYLGGMFGAVFYVRYQELQLERLGLALMEPPGPVADVR